MPRNKQLDRLAQIIRTLEQGLAGSVAALQKNIRALTSGGGITSAKARRELTRALARLRAALNKAILALEKKIGGGAAPRAKKTGGAKRRKKAA